MPLASEPWRGRQGVAVTLVATVARGSEHEGPGNLTEDSQFSAPVVCKQLTNAQVDVSAGTCGSSGTLMVTGQAETLAAVPGYNPSELQSG